MAKYIDADKLLEEMSVNALPRDAQRLYLAMRGMVRNAPTADVVEVVRCKDCKYQDDCARQMVHTTRDYVLEQNISTYNKVDFCSYGEKRSEEE